MIYAPILIPTLCRSEHLIRCIESLKQNGWAKYTDIYIALDYPAKESHWEGYKKIEEYLQGSFSEFAGFYVIKRNENYGSVRNMKELRDMILKKYDRFIRIDDDCELSPNFLEYMDRCLEMYEDDKDVIAVTGYSFPINWSVSDEANIFKSKIHFSMWGTGFWRNKFYKLQELFIEPNWFVRNFEGFMKSKKIHHLTHIAFDDYVKCGTAYKEYKGFLNLFSDRALNTYIQLENKYIITPTFSKVRNYGFDGTGVTCPVSSNTLRERGRMHSSHNYNFQLQKIDSCDVFEIHNDVLQDDKENRTLLNRFDTVSKYVLLKDWVKCFLYKMLGSRKYINFMKKVHK